MTTNQRSQGKKGFKVISQLKSQKTLHGKPHYESRFLCLIFCFVKKHETILLLFSTFFDLLTLMTLMTLMYVG